MEAPQLTPGLKRSVSNDKFRRDKDTSDMIQIVHAPKAAARSFLSALGGGCNNTAAPPTSAFSTALKAGPPGAPLLQWVLLAIATCRQAAHPCCC